MTGRSTRPQLRTGTGTPGKGNGGGPRASAPANPQSAREIFGRFVRTLEQLDAARAGSTAAAKEQKADTVQTWEVPGCGKR